MIRFEPNVYNIIYHTEGGVCFSRCYFDISVVSVFCDVAWLSVRHGIDGGLRQC